MSHTWWLPQLTEGKLFEGKAEQKTSQGEEFVVRKDAMGFYIAWKGTGKQVDNTGNFNEWAEAKFFLAQNYKIFLEAEFEKTFLTPDEPNDVD